MSTGKTYVNSRLPGKFTELTSLICTQYLGSTEVKEPRGTESTKQSIQKLKHAVASGAQRTLPEVVLVISYRGVMFMDPVSSSLVCEHEIRNIDCACQDADDLNHFAYITKDHLTSSHYSHVFSVASMVSL